MGMFAVCLLHCGTYLRKHLRSLTHLFVHIICSTVQLLNCSADVLLFSISKLSFVSGKCRVPVSLVLWAVPSLERPVDGDQVREIL